MQSLKDTSKYEKMIPDDPENRLSLVSTRLIKGMLMPDDDTTDESDGIGRASKLKAGNIATDMARQTLCFLRDPVAFRGDTEPSL